MTDRMTLQVAEGGRARRIAVLSAPVAVFGRPFGEGDFWLGVSDSDGQPDRERTLGIDNRHFALRYDGAEATVRDLGSAKGTRLNGLDLDGNWRVIRCGDVVSVAGGLVELRAWFAESGDASSPGGRYACLRLTPGDDYYYAAYILLPGRFAVGSAPDCAVRLADAPARAASVIRSGDGYWLEAGGREEVTDGREIRFGDATLSAFIPQPAPKEIPIRTGRYGRTVSGEPEQKNN